MKTTKVFLLLLTILIANKMSAQDSTRYLFKKSQIHSLGIYIEPQLGIVSVGDDNFTTGRSSLMFIFNQRFAVGLSNSKFLSHDLKLKAYPELYIHNRSAGLKMEYTFYPQSLVHFTIPLYIGMNRIFTDSISNRNNHNPNNERRFYPYEIGNRSTGMLIRPGINLEVNILPCLKFYVGAEYQSNVDIEKSNSPINLDTLNGLILSGGFKFGAFNMHKPHHYFGHWGRIHKEKS